MAKQIFRFIWTLPQNFLGLLVFLAGKCMDTPSRSGNGVTVTWWGSTSGLSLGRFLFVHSLARPETMRHEYGHYKQSLILGWLWLPLVGLPSLLWCCWYTCCGRKHGANYYRFYTERWADKLGGVNREET